LQKLGLQTEMLNIKTDPEVLSTYQHVVSRYIGIHTAVPSKTASEAFCQSMSALGLAERSLETVFDSQLNERDLEEDNTNETRKSVIANNSLMKNNRPAIENAALRKKFQKDHPELPLKVLKVEKAYSEHMLMFKDGMHPIFGKIMAETISVVDGIMERHEVSGRIFSSSYNEMKTRIHFPCGLSSTRQSCQ